MRSLMLAASKKMGNAHFKADSPFPTWRSRRAARLCNGHAVREGADLMPCEKTRVLQHQRPIAAVGEAVICRRPGAQVNKLELSWLEGI